MDEKILVVDQQKCTGCRQCEMVCSVFHTGASNPSRSRIKVVKWEAIGLYLPLACNHCEKAYCVEVCPTKACHREPENNNRVTIDIYNIAGQKIHSESNKLIYPGNSRKVQPGATGVYLVLC